MGKPIPWTRVLGTLRRVFRLDALRPGQEKVIRSVLGHRHTLAIMPTGAGKSLCYQLPAVLMPGTTVVVSPLISLMKDQAEKLEELGVEARQVNSTLTTSEEREALAHIEDERSEFVLTTPERLATPEFLETLTSNTIDLFVVDEAHCISQWGHDFRPAYLQLRQAIAALGSPPVLALTATATDRVITDIATQLGIDDFHIVNTGTYRPNLRYAVVPCADEEERAAALDRLLEDVEGTGIVYVPTVKLAELVHSRLVAQFGDAAGLYHGKLRVAARKESQERFMRGELTVMVATNAFGLGIDKPDIRFIVHYGMPGSLESYYQEAGRAGRAAQCTLLYEKQDRRVQLFFMGGKYPTPEMVLAVYRALVARTREGGRATLADLRADVPAVPLSRLRVIVALLKEHRIVREHRGATFSMRSARAEDEVLGLADAWRERSEADRARLDRMLMYAQTGLCRWQVMVDYFGESLERETCEHCDNCARAASRPAPLADVDLQQPVAVVLQEAQAALQAAQAVHVGDRVTTPQDGEGEVVGLHDDKVDVRFADGATRTFKREFVEPTPRDTNVSAGRRARPTASADRSAT